MGPKTSVASSACSLVCSTTPASTTLFPCVHPSAGGEQYLPKPLSANAHKHGLELLCLLRYYLKNLCDEDSFRGWPVVDHIPFLQALMEQWRAELGRQPLAMSETQACETLGIAAGAGGLVSEDDMRKAYRALARRYVCSYYGAAQLPGRPAWHLNTGRTCLLFIIYT